MNGTVELRVLQTYNASILGSSCELNPGFTEGFNMSSYNTRKLTKNLRRTLYTTRKCKKANIY
jgi:hypothetical protein